MYYSAISLLAALILLIENRDILRDNTMDKPAWNVYRRFLLAVLAYYVTDVLWGILESKKLSFLLFADTTVYFVAMGVGVLFWAQFLVAYLEEESEFGRFLVASGRIVAWGIAFLAAVNTFLPVLFIVDGDCVYRALPARYWMLACQIVLLLMISAYALYMRHFRHTKQEARYRALAMFGFCMALFLFMQLFFPYLPLYGIAYMLGTSVLHSYVVNDEMEEYKRGLDEAEKIRALKDTIVSLLDNMPAMTFTKDAETGVYLACNRAFARSALRDGPSDVVGRSAEELFGAERANRFARDDRIALSMDEPYIYYEDVLNAEGGQHQLQTTKLKYYNLDGQLCVLGMCQDVTDLVRIQHENATTKEAYEKARSTGIIYTHIAQALARGYTDLYYINLDSEEFIKYRNNDESGTLVEERRGWHFFEACRLRMEKIVVPEERAAVVKALGRKTLVAALDRNKTFVMTFRIMMQDAPRYVTIRISRMADDERFIVLGLTDVDSQMKQRRAALRAREEQIAYARINALSGDYLCIYLVDPDTGAFREFSSNDRYGALRSEKEGSDFFGASVESIRAHCYHEDLKRVLSAFSKESILSEIARRGIFTLSYRLVLDGVPLYVQLKAAMVKEQEGDRLIVGVIDVDAQVRQEEEYVKSLAEARISANLDALTGVKNRHAYLEAEERLNALIEQNRAPRFAVVLLDVNDLKKVNDTAGHKAGDQYLRDACGIICDIFHESEVYRVGGDEFVILAQGEDYERVEELTVQMGDHNDEALRGGGIVIACGMAKQVDGERVAAVLERADKRMYENKSELKARRGG